MCFHCIDRVSSAIVRRFCDQVIMILQALGVGHDANVAVALRMIARLAQSEQWHDAIEKFANGEISREAMQELQEAAFAQAVDYADGYAPVSVDKFQVQNVFGTVLDSMAASAVPLSNPLCAAFLSLSDLMLSSPDVPPTQEQVNEIIESNVFLFNAEKDLQSGGYSIN